MVYSKKIELKDQAFKTALEAISAFECDALNIDLQEKKDNKKLQYITNHKHETRRLLFQAQGLIRLYFSNEVYESYIKLCKTKISLDNIPNTEFDNAKNSFIEVVKQEHIN